MEKQTLFWLFVGIFAVTAVITLLGITGVIKTIKEKYLNTLFTALILEVIAAVFLIFQGLDFAENPVNLSAIIVNSGRIGSHLLLSFLFLSLKQPGNFLIAHFPLLAFSTEGFQTIY